MHLRLWVYRRNPSRNRKSPFRSNENFMQKVGWFMSGCLGLVFFALALLSVFPSDENKNGQLFLSFVSLFVIFGAICLIYSFIPCFQKYCRRTEDVEEDEYSSGSFLSSIASAYEEVPGNQGMASYQTCVDLPEAPDYPAGPSYQAGAGYQELPSYPGPSYDAEGGIPPGSLQPMVDCEDVFVQQKTPIYQQDLIEPQLPHYSQGYIHRIYIPKTDIHIY